MASDGRELLSGSFDYSMIVWAVPGTSAAKIRHRYDDVEGAINAVAATGKLAVFAGDDGLVRTLDRATGKRVAEARGHTHKINALDVSPTGDRVVSASWDRTARVWTLPRLDGDAVILKGHGGPVTAAVFSSDGRFVFTASSDGKLRRFNAASGALDRVVFNHGWGLNVLTRVAGRDLIAFGATDGAVGLLDAKTGERRKTLAKHEKPVLAIAFGERRLATAGGDGVIRVWNADDWTPIEEYRNPFGPIWALAFSTDAKTLYYGVQSSAFQTRITPSPPAVANRRPP
ncbi:MAG: WD40 repeat domain-containing protein, partial [Pseudomonadota bacterium]